MKPFCVACLVTSVALGLLDSLVLAQDVPKAQASPEAVARASFEALQKNDFESFAALFHPEESKRFKDFAVGVFEYENPDREIEQIRKMFGDFDSAEKVKGATGRDLLNGFLTTVYSMNPGFEDIIRQAKLEILGTIQEQPDKVHVITRTVLPRPSPVSCRQSEGTWYQLLNEETLRMVSAFERKEHFREKALSGQNLAAAVKMDKVDVLGHVPDGEDTAQVLCRVWMKLDDFSFPVFGCYPVRKDEPAWKHLDDEDTELLVEALRAKWTGR